MPGDENVTHSKITTRGLFNGGDANSGPHDSIGSKTNHNASVGAQTSSFPRSGLIFPTLLSSSPKSVDVVSSITAIKSVGNFISPETKPLMSESPPIFNSSPTLK